jgi:hypothetical protein
LRGLRVSSILLGMPQARKITKSTAARGRKPTRAAGSASKGAPVNDQGAVVVREAKTRPTARGGGRSKTTKTDNSATLGAATSSARTTSRTGGRRSATCSSAPTPAARHARDVTSTELHEPLTATLHEIIGKGAIGAAKMATALTGGSPAVQRLRDLLDRALAAGAGDDGLATDVWGPEPTRAEVMDAQARAELLRAAALEQTVRDSLTRDEVAARLGITTQAVSKRTKADQLVALRHGGRIQYPLWQFADDGAITNLPELADQFPSALSLSVWMTTPSADLDGLTPTQMLQQRDGRERVLELAHAAGPAAW